MEKKNKFLIATIISLFFSILFICSYFNQLNNIYNCPIYYTTSDIFSTGNQNYTLTATIVNRTDKDIYIDTLTFYISGSKDSYSKYSINNITIEANSPYNINENLVSFSSSFYTLRGARPQSAVIDGETHYLKQSYDGKDFGENDVFTLIMGLVTLIIAITCTVFYFKEGKYDIQQYVNEKRIIKYEKKIWKVIDYIYNKHHPFNNFNNETNILKFLKTTFRPTKKNVFVVKTKQYSHDKILHYLFISNNLKNDHTTAIGIINNDTNNLTTIFKLSSNGEIMKCKYSSLFGFVAINIIKLEYTANIINDFEKFLNNYKEEKK